MTLQALEKYLHYRDGIFAADLLLCAVTHLDFITELQQQPRNFTDISRHFEIQPRPTDVLLTLLCALDILELKDGAFRPSAAAQDFLDGNSPNSLTPYYHSIKHRPQCIEFYEVLKSGKPAGWSSKKGGSGWLESMRSPEFAQAFTDAMDSRGNLLAEALAVNLPLKQHRKLLDIAGGSGIYACRFAQAHPHLEAAILEIPPVDAVARRSIQEKGFQDKVAVLSGDMFEQLPDGFDVHLFANVFHDWDMDTVRQLAHHAYQQLPPEGRIVVFDAHLNDTKDGPLCVAEYSCLLMHSTFGRCYAHNEITAILREAGFRNLQALPIAAARSAILGEK